MKLSILIPVYNEIHTIKQILQKIEKVVLPDPIKSKELIIVDDGSTDGTREFLQQFTNKKYTIIFNDKNRGKGFCLKKCQDYITGELVIIQDADLEYDPIEYNFLLLPILDGTADVVYGSRFLKKIPGIKRNVFKILANKSITFLSNFFSHLNLTDVATCYKAFKTEIFKSLNLEERGFGIDVEITAKLAVQVRRNKIVLYETAISYNPRTYKEKKKLKLKDGFRILWSICKYNTLWFN